MVDSVFYTRLDAHDWNSLNIKLPAFLLERISKYARAADRDARTAGYWLLEKLLNESGIDPGALNTLSYSPFGRPYFPNLNFDFNISHSGQYVVCGAVQGGRIGIDIEQILPIDIGEGRAAFPAEVWGEIVGSERSLHSFYRAWTRMEAVAKAEGFGVGGPIGSIIFREGAAWVDERRWHFFEIPVDPDYCCHVALSRASYPALVRQI